MQTKDVNDAFSSFKVDRRGLFRGAAALGALAVFPQVLTACAESSPGGSGQGTTQISMWSNHPEWSDILKKALAKFESENPDYKVDLTLRPNATYTTSLNSALAADAAPDLIGFLDIGSVTDAVANGQITLPVDFDAKQLVPAAAQVVVQDGVANAVPLAAYSVGIYYQRAIFEKLGLQPPTTWDELTDTCKKLQAAGVVPFSMPAKDMVLPYYFVTLAASSVLGPDGFAQLLSGERKMTDPDVVRAIQYMVDLTPYYNKGFQAVDYNTGKALFAQGKTAMIIGGSSDYSGYKLIDENIDVGVFGFPTPEAGGDVEHVTVTGLELLYAVNAKSKNQKGSEVLLNWLASESCQQVIADDLADPIRVGVSNESGGDRGRVANEMSAAGAPALAAWDNVPQTAGALEAITSPEASTIFTGGMSAKDLAEAIQAKFKIS